jgi:hypothetical protein
MYDVELDLDAADDKPGLVAANPKKNQVFVWDVQTSVWRSGPTRLFS